MALWDKLKVEVDKAGRVAQKAVDEGKARLDLARAKQRSDRAAQAQPAAVLADGDAGRVVATVFQPPQAFDQERRDILGRDRADDSAHGAFSP